MISLQPSNNNDAFDGVAHMLDRLRNLSNADQANVADAINRGFGSNFDNQQAGDEAPWISLALATVRQRAKRGFGPTPILVQTGKYRDSFEKRGADGHVEKFRGTRTGWILESGSQDERVGILEFGGTNSTGRFVPPRPASFLSDVAEGRVFDVLNSITDRIMATGA
jgi:hypothetical protein